MKVYEIQKGSTSLEGLRRAERPDPQPGANQVLVRVRATALNYRDQGILTGRYFGGTVTRNLIPLSDGAGEVVAVGPGVTRFKPGDLVVPTFFQVWIAGPRVGARSALGSPLDGTLCEYIVLHEDGFVAAPKGLSPEEACTLGCAALTAWNGLMVAGKQVKAGDTVLCMGTGGVSIFALQFARAAGARVIITSSSDEKLERARKLGASEGINYKRFPEWEKEVSRLTDGRGVDCVVEVGGMGTLQKSFDTVGIGGKVSLIGVLTGEKGSANPHGLMFKDASLHGIGVGNRVMFEDMNRAIEINKIKPVIDKFFPFEGAAEGYREHGAGNFMGKVVIRI